MQEVLNTIKSEVLLKYPNSEVYLFGSRAIGKHRDDSDYDISVKVNTDDVVYRYDKKLSDCIRNKTGENVNLVFCKIDNEWNLIKL